MHEPDSGIYLIRNTATGRVYVGSAIHTPARLKEHRRQLVKYHHPNALLQHDWLVFGASTFDFLHLATVTAGAFALEAAEQRWIDHYRAASGVYNIAHASRADARMEQHAATATVIAVPAEREGPAPGIPARLIDANGVGAILNISRARVSQLADAGRFATYRKAVGGIRFYDPVEVLALATARGVTVPDSALAPETTLELPACAGCQAPLTRQHGNRIYCSRACASRTRYLRRKAAAATMPRPPREPRPLTTHAKICRTCGAQFIAQSSRAQYCSRACFDRANGARRRGLGLPPERQQTRRRGLSRPPERQQTCPICGEVFVTTNAQVRYCEPHRVEVRRHRSAAEQRPNIKLTPAAVREMRTRYAQGETVKSLARAYGVSPRGAGKAIRGETWRHVDGPRMAGRNVTQAPRRARQSDGQLPLWDVNTAATGAA